MKQKVEVSAIEVGQIVKDHLVKEGALPENRDIQIYILPKKADKNDSSAVFASFFGGQSFGGLEFEILPEDHGKEDENRDQTDS